MSAPSTARPAPLPGRWPSALRLTVSAVGLCGLLGTLPPLLATPRPPSWLAPALADVTSRPLRADLPDTTFARLHAGYTDEIRFASQAFGQALLAAHRHPDRWLAAPLFLALAAAPWLPPRRGRPGREIPGGPIARAALLLLVPLQMLFHSTSIQPLLGAWVDLTGNLTRTLITIQIEAYSYFAPGVTRAVALFFAQESPHLEAQLQRQLWLLRGADLLLAACEAALLLWLARGIRRAGDPPSAGGAPSPGDSPPVGA